MSTNNQNTNRQASSDSSENLDLQQVLSEFQDLIPELQSAIVEQQEEVATAIAGHRRVLEQVLQRLDQLEAKSRQSEQ